MFRSNRRLFKLIWHVVSFILSDITKSKQNLESLLSIIILFLGDWSLKRHNIVIKNAEHKVSSQGWVCPRTINNSIQNEKDKLSQHFTILLSKPGTINSEQKFKQCVPLHLSLSAAVPECRGVDKQVLQKWLRYGNKLYSGIAPF